MGVHAGREQHKTPLTGAAHTLEDISHRSAPSAYVLDSLRETRALKQLGTLGGGNHFLEVCRLHLHIPLSLMVQESPGETVCPQKASLRLVSTGSEHDGISLLHGCPCHCRVGAKMHPYDHGQSWLAGSCA